jgi:hypothetical protein
MDAELSGRILLTSPHGQQNLRMPGPSGLWMSHGSRAGSLDYPERSR